MQAFEESPELEFNPELSVAMDAKSPKQNLDFHVRKLDRYLRSLNIKYGLLTNGNEIEFMLEIKQIFN